MMQYDMPNGQKLVIGGIPNHGVVKAPFACRKVIVSETETSYFIEDWLDGFFQPDECLEWLGVSANAARHAKPKRRNMFTKILRVILTFALVYASYRETGFFTALCFLLIFVAIELQDWLNKR